MTAGDTKTAEAFSESWNRVGEGSVYTRDQFLDWVDPLQPSDIAGRDVIELGFGNGSLLYHVARCEPRRLAGIELGDTADTTRRNLGELAEGVELNRGDLTRANLGEFDLVYCIGVLHHLADPDSGFDAVLRHVRAGGRFHCWVYAHEGNAVVRIFVEPLRRIASRLPWWFTKYAIALPLAVPFRAAATIAAAMHRAAPLRSIGRHLPLFDYLLWIAPRPFRFFRHVAFDQLVTPRTVYVTRQQVDRWLTRAEIDPDSTYVIFRNGNSWKFGGRRRT